MFTVALEDSHIEFATYFLVVTSSLAVLYFIRRYMAGGVCRCTDRLDGKTVIITGANIGIGEATALELAKRGARIVLACRDLDKAEATSAALKIRSKSDQIVIAKLDLASLASCRRFCKYIHQSERRVDVLINNAGVYWVPRIITEDGNEMQFQVNYLGHFLITLLLLKKMWEQGEGRIINVSSIAHGTSIDFDNLDGAKHYNKQRRYQQSKLAQILFTRHLANKLKNVGKSAITVNALHPGVVRSGITRTFPWLTTQIGRIINWPVMMLLFKSTEEGAQTAIHCAVSEDGGTLTGHYFKDCKVAEPRQVAMDAEQAEQLWNVSLKKVGLDEDDQAISFLNRSSKNESCT